MNTETPVPAGTATVLDPNKIISETSAKLLADAVNAGWSKVRKFFKDLHRDYSIRCGNAYEDYLKNTITSICQVKTLIFDSIPKYLYSFYEIPNLQYQDNLIDVSDVQDLLDLGNKLLITGTGGLGKSLLLKHLFLNTAQHGYYIPVLIQLRNCNHLEAEKISLEDVIYQNLYNHGFQLEKNYYSSSLEQGGYLILLDGLDEVRQEKVERVFESIREFTGRYGKNHVIVSSRPSDRLIGWSDFPELFLCDLTKDQAFQLIRKIDYDQETKTAFLEALDDGTFETYQSFASNPLLLTIMLLTFSKYAVLPKNLNAFYDQAFSTLFYRHDRTKGYFTRDLHSHLGYDDFKNLFASFCFHSYFSEDFEFTEDQLRQYIQSARGIIENQSFTNDDVIEDLTSSVCMLVREGFHYQFIHRSFQEYFAAWYTCKLTDHEQNNLLTAYLLESGIYAANKYFQMLFDLQPDKVNKMILCPGIKKLKDLYQSKRFSINLLISLFDGIYITRFRFYNDDSWLSFPVLGLWSRNDYLCKILNLTCELNYGSYLLDVISEPEDSECIYKLLKNTQNPLNDHSWSFKEALSLVSSDELLNRLEWCDSRFQQCFEIYNRYNQDSISDKNTVSSIIEELY